MSQERSKLPTIWDPAPPPVSGVDNSAFVGKKPTKVIPVASEYRRQTLTRERQLLTNDIKHETDCDVVPHWDQGKITSFDIYGPAYGVEKATTRLNEWISNAHTKSIGASAWAKLPAYDYNKWYYAQVEERDNEWKQQFKGPFPSQDDENAPKYTSFVDWPGDIQGPSQEPLTPRDVFGNKLERLDGLRMQDKVYISLLGQWQLEIAGYEAEDVATAREHLRTMIKKVRADAVGVHHTLNIILDEREGINVQLQQDEAWWPIHIDRVVPRLLPSAMMNEPGSFREDGIDHIQLSVLQKKIKVALNHVRQRRGAYDFVVRLGSLALSSKHVGVDKIGQTYTKDKFLKDIDEKIELDVKKWLANDEVGHCILHGLMAAKDFLEPTKSAGYFGHTPASLQDTRPTFRGTWVFQDPNSPVSQPRAPSRHAGRPAPLKASKNEDITPPSTSLFVIQVDWTDDEEGLYEKGTPRFYKLEAGKHGPKKHMDINLLELGESRAWHFALESLILVPRNTVSPVLSGFADRVTMKPKYDIASTEGFAQWYTTPTIKRYLQMGRLDRIYSFGIKKTCYKVELSAMWYPGQAVPVWGLSVRHAEWATHLAELENLPIGRQASWADTISTFLPDDGQSAAWVDEDDEDHGMSKLKVADEEDEEDDHEAVAEKEVPPRDGIRILTDKLLKLSEIVSSATEDGGVRI